MKKSFICPFCFQKYNLRNVLYICLGCEKASYPSKFEKEPVKCKNCSGFATQRVCKECEREVPKSMLETSNFAISIVGTTYSGKTNYITVMLNELSKSTGLKLMINTQDEHTHSYQNDNYELIYEHHRVPASNAPCMTSPLIWDIKNLRKGKAHDVSSYTFTIYDGAGDEQVSCMKNNDTYYCGYIDISDAIIFAINPLGLDSIKYHGVVDQQIMENSLAGNDSSLIQRQLIDDTALRMRMAKGININKKLNTPVAVLLTKLDTILSHKSFGPSALIKRHSLIINDGKIAISEIQQIDEEIRYWLLDIGEDLFINTLESNFKEFYFFGVSSYGEPPKNTATLPDRIRPHRVLDPILWLFKKFDFID